MKLKRKEVAGLMLQPQVTGVRAVYIVEARNRQERKEIRELFDNIAEVYPVLPLSEGVIMSYVIQVDGDTSAISEVEQILKTNYAFCVLERSFNDTIYQVIQDLCMETNSRLCRIPHCGICGRLEPFPTKVSMLDENNLPVMEVHYCSRCVATQANRNEKQALVDLLSHDRRNFSAIREAKLVKRSNRRKTNETLPDTKVYRIAS